MDFATTVKCLSLNLHWLGAPALALALLSAVSACAQETPTFTVSTAEGKSLVGVWHSLNADWSLRIGDGDGSRIAGKDVVSVRRAGAALPPLPRDDHLVLANGDRVPFKTLRLDDEKLYLRHVYLEDGKETSLPLAAVSLLWRIAPDKTHDAEKLRRRLLAAQRTRDRLCLRNGDIVAGVLTGLNKENVIVEVEDKPVTVKMEQVAYIAFNTELAETPRIKGVYAHLVLMDTRQSGGRLSLKSASCDGSVLSGVTVFGARLRVPLAGVAALDLYQGRAIYLSDLKPSKYEYHPYLDADWPFRADANVAEHDLRLNGSTYDKGIGLHSHSRLSYHLSGGYRRFEALVGLDDKDGRRGRVRVRVLTDGKTLVDRVLSRQEGPLPIRVDIAAARTLTLEVDFDRDGDVQDVVDWADARLIRRK